MRYEGDIYRPPSEAYSLLIQVTIGCSWNKCSFCALYGKKQFRVREPEEIFKDLEECRRRYLQVEKIFLCDGDALCLSMDRLCAILDRCRALFPECRSVNVYGNARDVLAKGHENLKLLGEKGIGIIYIGAESGSDIILSEVNKGVSANDTRSAIRMIEDSGIKASVTFISGLGGLAGMVEHAVESGRLVSETAPSYFSLLTLVLTRDMPIYQRFKTGELSALSTPEVLEETRLFFESIKLPDKIESSAEPGVFRPVSCVFRSNHVSNAFPLRGTLPEDKEAILNTIILCRQRIK